MASQYRRVTGNTRRYPTGDAALQAKIAMLPARLQAQQERKMLADQKKMQKKQMAKDGKTFLCAEGNIKALIKYA